MIQDSAKRIRQSTAPFQEPVENHAKIGFGRYQSSNNINQIAHWTNGKGYATQAEIHEAVSLVKQAYRRILDTL